METQAPSSKWSETVPFEPGYYLWRLAEGGPATIAQVTKLLHWGHHLPPTEHDVRVFLPGGPCDGYRIVGDEPLVPKGVWGSRVDLALAQHDAERAVLRSVQKIERSLASLAQSTAAIAKCLEGRDVRERMAGVLEMKKREQAALDVLCGSNAELRKAIEKVLA